MFRVRRRLKKVVVIVSHPRSGTHLTLDFIRKNFAAFKQPVPIWFSAANLCVDLDHEYWPIQLDKLASKSEYILLHGHLMPFSEMTLSGIKEIDTEELIFIYPFRDFAATMKSFAEFCGHRGSVLSFLGVIHNFYPHETVEAFANRHALYWMEQGAFLLNMDALIAAPDRSAQCLAKILELSPEVIQHRLPRRKLFKGKFGELVTRMTGRESTEVKVDHTLSWSDPKERRAVNERFGELYEAMLKRSII